MSPRKLIQRFTRLGATMRREQEVSQEEAEEKKATEKIHHLVPTAAFVHPLHSLCCALLPVAGQ